MTEFCLVFTYPLVDGWDVIEDKLSLLMIEHGGTYDGGGTDFSRRDTVGYFETREAAEACGKAAHALSIQFLSWEVDEVEETA